MSVGEFGYIALLREALGGDRLSPEGIGDDAAVLRPSDGRVIAVDTMVEGVHWDPRWSGPGDVAWKLLASNVSDIRAMGAEPRVALLSASLSRPPTEDEVRAWAAGFRAASEAWEVEVALVGGDTTRSPGGTVYSLTVVGALDGPAIRRDGARPGDRVWLDGEPGLAAAGLEILRRGVAPPWTEAVVRAVGQHRRPWHPVRRLTSRPAGGVDISDGLAADLWHVARASSVGIELDTGALVSDAVREVAGVVGADALSLVLGGGDDYCRAWFSQAAPFAGATPVGRVVSGRVALTGIGADGSRLELQSQGYRHFQD